MKSTILVFILLISVISSKAQEFAPLGAKWYYSFTPWSYPLRNEAVVVESIKDTIVKNINCRKMSGVGSNFLYSIGNKVFIFNIYINDFVKIYDFDLQVGDTLKFIYGHDSLKSAYVIDSLGFMTINSKLKKVQYISPIMPNLNGENLWVFYGYNIESIGNKNYLFPQYAMADPLINGGLRCYEDTAIGYYNSGLVNICDTIVYLSINENYSIFINIYPNPATDYIHIENLAEKAKIEIYKMDGMIQQSIDVNVNSKINIKNLLNGLYLIKIQTDKGVIIKKFVKL